MKTLISSCSTNSEAIFPYQRSPILIVSLEECRVSSDTLPNYILSDTNLSSINSLGLCRFPFKSMFFCRKIER